jgi:hemoglobin
VSRRVSPSVTGRLVPRSDAAAPGGTRRDIDGREDITALLTDFYGRAFGDELLGPVFVDIARMDLAEHLPVMCDFWLTVLFHTGQYRRNALHPHQRLHSKAQLTPTHFDRWLTLWQATVDDRHVGAKADLAKLQATRIAGAMCRRITGRASPRLDPPLTPPTSGSRYAATHAATAVFGDADRERIR